MFFTNGSIFLTNGKNLIFSLKKQANAGYLYYCKLSTIQQVWRSPQIIGTFIFGKKFGKIFPDFEKRAWVRAILLRRNQTIL
jgi:hypothetical protein